MSKFIGHWYKSKYQEAIYKVLGHAKCDSPAQETISSKYIYNVQMVASNGDVWKTVLFLSDSLIGTQIDAAKARAWKRYVTSVRGIATYKFNKL